jgi:ribonuclease Y
MVAYDKACTIVIDGADAQIDGFVPWNVVIDVPTVPSVPYHHAVLMESMENEAKHEAAKRIKRIEEEARELADKKSKEIISLAVQRYAGEYVAEKTVSVVNLPNEEMKGRIIGSEGRNIRALEAATGVDLIIDDTPEAVILSGFNPVRREIARIALERLVSDGRIHPARIEEIVQKVEQEVETSIREAGEQATFDVGVHGMHPELIKLIGRLKYRTSFAQNVYQHSLEVAFLCGVMASELGVNVKQAKRAGLLHDIGKNIVVTLLRNAGFKTIDLGVDVNADRFVETVTASGAKALALSCLLNLPSRR